MEYELDHIEKQIQYWQAMKDQHLKSNKEYEIDDNTQKLLHRIFDITPENSIRECLYSDTRTVPIIDKYYDSPAKFLIIERAFIHNVHGNLSLVICKSPRDVRLTHSALTMTNLKQESRSYIGTSAVARYKDTRFHGLIQSIAEVLDENIKQGYVPFKTPCQFNAQRSANRTGYGNEYYGDTLLYEGTNYGETTTFAIIGVIIEF